ncbi:hypothetical protein GY45DRAFT_1371155 [Cubamyces sp. BRFM 1775]|nr:hypothetical protein GY45DRAFT_1371155 [Cubamyces sp. BRFM 1775]
MASGQLSPYPSCADGLGLMNCADHRSASSLLTPTASVCTVSSLGGGPASEGDARGRMKTMQTKDILKSPQPHRFHLVPSGRKRAKTTEPPRDRGMSSRPSAQWRFKDGRLASPDDERRREEDGRGGFFSPQVSPVLTTTQDIMTDQQDLYSPRLAYASEDDYAQEDHLASDHLRSPDMVDSRPTSTCSALSSQTTSVSFTLVQDQASKRFSTASDTVNLKMVLRDDDFRRASVLHESSAAESADGYVHAQNEADEVHLGDDVLVLSPQCDDVVESPEHIISEVPDTVDGLNAVGHPADSTQTPSASLESLMSAYDMLPQSDVPMPYTDGRHTIPAIPTTPQALPAATSSPKVNRRATDTSLVSPSKKPAATSSTRDRRKFALRRQAIYAEYGFQIALPDSDSESSVKLLASPSRKGRAVVQGRAASAEAYVTGAGLPGSASRWAVEEVDEARCHLGLSLSGSAGSTGSLGAAAIRAGTGPDTGVGDTSLAASESSASGGDDLRSRLFASTNSTMTLHGVLAHDRLERLSVQDDILGATRHTLADLNSGSDLASNADTAGLTTSTPPPSLVKGRAAERRTLAMGISTSDSGTGYGSHLGFGSESGDCGLSLHDNLQLLSATWQSSLRTPNTGTGWAPLRIVKRNPAPIQARALSRREKARLSVSRSERSARLSAWEVDPGHHPILRELIDEVDRAIEQWGQMGLMRMCV